MRVAKLLQGYLVEEGQKMLSDKIEPLKRLLHRFLFEQSFHLDQR